jgi:hypothetical protein
MAMTMRDVRRLLVLALGVAGVALATGASGASAVTLDCTGTTVWRFTPPLSSRSQTMDVTTDETLTACTGTGAGIAPAGTATDTFKVTGTCERIFLPGSGRKTFVWPLFSQSSNFSYFLTGARQDGSISDGTEGEYFTLSGTITSGIFAGSTATDVISARGMAFGYFIAKCQSGSTFGTLTGTAHLTIN